MADLILHAGDVCTAEVLDELSSLCTGPRCARQQRRRGRRCVGAQEAIELDLDGLSGDGSRQRRHGRARGAHAPQFPDAALVVFGHSHIPLDQTDVAVRSPDLQPGSPTDRRRQPYGTLGLLRDRARPARGGKNRPSNLSRRPVTAAHGGTKSLAAVRSLGTSSIMTTPSVAVRTARTRDAAEIFQISAPIVRATTISSESEPPHAAALARRLTAGLVWLPWLVAQTPQGIAGYAYAAIYRGSRHTAGRLRRPFTSILPLVGAALAWLCARACSPTRAGSATSLPTRDRAAEQHKRAAARSRRFPAHRGVSGRWFSTGAGSTWAGGRSRCARRPPRPTRRWPGARSGRPR